MTLCQTMHALCSNVKEIMSQREMKHVLVQAALNVTLTQCSDVLDPK